MKYHRPERMGHLIRNELAGMLLREFEFPNALITLTEVEVSADIEHAKAKISIIPHTAAVKVLKSLQKMTGFFQHKLDFKLNLRPMPRIAFVLDHGPERAAQIEKDFIEIEKGSNRE